MFCLYNISKNFWSRTDLILLKTATLLGNFAFSCQICGFQQNLSSNITPSHTGLPWTRSKSTLLIIIFDCIAFVFIAVSKYHEFCFFLNLVKMYCFWDNILVFLFGNGKEVFWSQTLGVHLSRLMVKDINGDMQKDDKQIWEVARIAVKANVN